MIVENNIENKGIVNSIGNSLLEFILLGRIPFSNKKYSEIKTQAELMVILPMRIISLLVALFGLLAMVFEVKLYPQYSVEIYIIRLTATVIAFSILTALSTPLAQRNPVTLVHLLLLTIIVSSGLMIFLLPRTLLVNSSIVGLLIFTSALFFSWEVKNQIIVAIYYNIVFAFAILLNDRIIYFLPNVAESVAFVIVFSMISIIACAINFRMRLLLAERNIQVEQSEYKFRSIIENSSEGIFQSSVDGHWITINKAFAKILGYKDPNELMQVGVREIYVSPWERDKLLQILKSTERVENYRIRLRKKDESVAVVKLNNRLVKEEDGTEYLEGNISDITAQVKAEEERNEAEAALTLEKEKSERLAKEAIQFSEMKSKFLANMSHEIRTPINGVLGFLTLIENGAYRDTDELKHFSSSARQSTESLLEIINSVLDLSKIEAGKVELDDVNFNLNMVVEQSLAVISPRALEKGIKITKEFQSGLKTNLVGDATKLRQIIINLLSNAVKFTKDGKITLKLSSDKISDEDVDLYVSVADTGLGIPHNKLNNLFKPYSQVKESQTNLIGSSGLGLAICKEYVDLMGGKIKVDSKVGQGSTFLFNIRFRIQPDTVHQKDNKIDPALVKNSLLVSGDLSFAANGLNKKREQYRILLVEDNNVNQAVSLKMLSLAGYNATAVNNGIEAIDSTKKHKFDAILMDIQMPEMDGFTATSEIRKLDSEQKDIPIIALTAHALMGDKDKCLDAGMNDYISKPIIGQELINKIDNLLDIHNNHESTVDLNKSEISGIFDYERLKNVSLGDAKFEEELLQSYLNDLEQKLERLITLSSEEDLEKVIELAHTIKGASYSVGAVKVGDEAYAIEVSGKSNDMFSVNERITNLETVIIETKSEIQKYFK
ncbi:MAG: response regulator [Ignavibacteriaceae bacterium]|nr:response regulator [Ignavibacteriaceae bacterium]